MKKMVQLIFMVYWLMLTSFTDAYPVESKPLNNNPETWNLGEGWNLYSQNESADPSASALISSDPHVKKSKITPKSIFIAPNSYTNDQLCPHGFRVDDDGKCIKTVTINQDEILAARISELFGIDESPNKNSDIDSDYYDFDDESKSEKDSGPLQINIPLSIDIGTDGEGQKIEYVIEETFSMRNLNPNDVKTMTEKIGEVSTLAPVTEQTESVPTEEPITSSTIDLVEETMTATETSSPISSTVKDDDDETTLISTTIEPVTESSTTTTTTQEPSTTTTTVTPVKIFSVDFLPKSPRKSNRLGLMSSRLKNSRDRDKFDRPRKEKTTAVSTKSNEKVTKLYKLSDQGSKKNRTRNGSKRPGHRRLTTTTEVMKETPVTTTTTTQKPFWWLPKGWSIDESKEKPVLVRFWSQQPLAQDERARSHNSRQRVNSRMPTDNIFHEVSASNVDSVMKK